MTEILTKLSFLLNCSAIRRYMALKKMRLDDVLEGKKISMALCMLNMQGFS